MEEGIIEWQIRWNTIFRQGANCDLKQPNKNWTLKFEIENELCDNKLGDYNQQ